jgi:hypothetical protein
MAGDLKIDTAGIGGLISGIGSAAKDIRAAITGKSVIDPAAQAELEMKLAQIEQDGLNAQAKVNEIEAGNKSLFVSGWRPFIGWVCGISIASNFLVRPYLVSFGLQIPELDVSMLYPLIFGMLGVVGARTAEKFKGVASK